MNIYVAGKWEEKEDVRAVMDMLENAGHSITYDWTTVEDGGDGREEAINDVEGITSADAMVCVFERKLAYSGALTEMGIAIAQGIPIYIMGDACNSNLFMNLPQIHRGIYSLLDRKAGTCIPIDTNNLRPNEKLSEYILRKRLDLSDLV